MQDDRGNLDNKTLMSEKKIRLLPKVLKIKQRKQEKYKSIYITDYIYYKNKNKKYIQ